MLLFPGYLHVSNILKIILNSGFYYVAFAILPCFGMLKKPQNTFIYKTKIFILSI